jgi:TonB family protein
MKRWPELLAVVLLCSGATAAACVACITPRQRLANRFAVVAEGVVVKRSPAGDKFGIQLTRNVEGVFRTGDATIQSTDGVDSCCFPPTKAPAIGTPVSLFVEGSTPRRTYWSLTLPARPPTPLAPPQSSLGPVAGKPTTFLSPMPLITNDDYPLSSIRAGEAGTTRMKLWVGVDGHVNSCSILQSSGASILDDTSCRLVTRRGRWAPPKAPFVYLMDHQWVLPR